MAKLEPICDCESLHCSEDGQHTAGRCPNPPTMKTVAWGEKQNMCESCYRVALNAGYPIEKVHNHFFRHSCAPDCPAYVAIPKEHPDTDLHRSGCGSCQMAYDKKLPDAGSPSLRFSRELTHRELATILHALRCIQAMPVHEHPCSEQGSCDHFVDGDGPILSDEEIDELCETINFGPEAVTEIESVPWRAIQLFELTDSGDPEGARYQISATTAYPDLPTVPIASVYDPDMAKAILALLQRELTVHSDHREDGQVSNA